VRSVYAEDSFIIKTFEEIRQFLAFLCATLVFTLLIDGTQFLTFNASSICFILAVCTYAQGLCFVGWKHSFQFLTSVIATIVLLTDMSLRCQYWLTNDLHQCLSSLQTTSHSCICSVDDPRAIHFTFVMALNFHFWINHCQTTMYSYKK
jgi:hypothetical protein